MRTTSVRSCAVASIVAADFLTAIGRTVRRAPLPPPRGRSDEKGERDDRSSMEVRGVPRPCGAGGSLRSGGGAISARRRQGEAEAAAGAQRHLYPEEREARA